MNSKTLQWIAYAFNFLIIVLALWGMWKKAFWLSLVLVILPFIALVAGALKDYSAEREHERELSHYSCIKHREDEATKIWCQANRTDTKEYWKGNAKMNKEIWEGFQKENE